MDERIFLREHSTRRNYKVLAIPAENGVSLPSPPTPSVSRTVLSKALWKIWHIVIFCCCSADAEMRTSERWGHNSSALFSLAELSLQDEIIYTEIWKPPHPNPLLGSPYTVHNLNQLFALPPSVTPRSTSCPMSQHWEDRPQLTLGALAHGGVSTC